MHPSLPASISTHPLLYIRGGTLYSLLLAMLVLLFSICATETGVSVGMSSSGLGCIAGSGCWWARCRIGCGLLAVCAAGTL